MPNTNRYRLAWSPFNFNPAEMRYCIRRTGAALGDHMMAAFFVRLLNDNGIDAVYGTGFYRDLVNVSLNVEGEDYRDFFFTYHYGDLDAPTFDPSKSIVETAPEAFPISIFRRMAFEETSA